MQLAASRRIRAHFNATHHFRAACSSAYHDVLGQRASSGVRPHALYIAVVRVHEVLGGSLSRYGRRAPFTPSWSRIERAFRTRCSQRRLDPDWDGFDRALRSVVRIRGSGLTEEIVILNEAEFEELTLDVIVEEVLWYLKFDAVTRILTMAVVTGVAAVGNPDQWGYLAALFGVFCVSMAALYSISVRFKTLFFLL